MSEQEQEKETKKTNKLTSAKLLITLWAIAMVTFIVVADRSNYGTIAQWLCAVPLAYIGANVWQKKIYSDKDGGK